MSSSVRNESERPVRAASRWHRPVRASVAIFSVVGAIALYASSGLAAVSIQRAGEVTRAAMPTATPSAYLSTLAIPTVPVEHPARPTQLAATAPRVSAHAASGSAHTSRAAAASTTPPSTTVPSSSGSRSVVPANSSVPASAVPSGVTPTSSSHPVPATGHPTPAVPAVSHPTPAVPTHRPIRAHPSVSRATPASPTHGAGTPGATPAQRAAASALLAHLNPTTNIAPSPNYLTSGTCSETATGWSCDNPCISSTLSWPTVDNAPSCTTYLVSAINHARAVEGVGALVLPTNWYQLSAPEQLFVILNLERTARGLPPYLGINAALSAAATRAAQAESDPSIAAGFPIGTNAQGYPTMGGTWSTGYSVLAADYAWMYNDGWGGSRATTSNVDCTSAGAAACWGHRDELLGQDPGYDPGVGLTSTTAEVGVGVAVVGGIGSFVDLIEAPKGAPPAMTFTWSAEEPYL